MALSPGASTEVRFSTAMHQGMDGTHLFRVTVPTTHPNAPAVSYTVRGDFR